MGDVRLRCKYQQGQKPIPNVKETTTLQELQGFIEAISGYGLKMIDTGQGYLRSEGFRLKFCRESVTLRRF